MHCQFLSIVMAEIFGFSLIFKPLDGTYLSSCLSMVGAILYSSIYPFSFLTIVNGFM